MFSRFITSKLGSAHYKLLDDGSYFGEIPGLEGVWANANALEGCREELATVLEEWLLLKIRAGDHIPGLNTTVRRVKAMHA